MGLKNARNRIQVIVTKSVVRVNCQSSRIKGGEVSLTAVHAMYLRRQLSSIRSRNIVDMRKAEAPNASMRDPTFTKLLLHPAMN